MNTMHSSKTSVGMTPLHAKNGKVSIPAAQKRNKKMSIMVVPANGGGGRSQFKLILFPYVVSEPTVSSLLFKVCSFSDYKFGITRKGHECNSILFQSFFTKKILFYNSI